MTKIKITTEFLIKYPDGSVLKSYGKSKQIRKRIKENNGIILSAVPMVHTESIGTHRYLDYVLRNWTDTSTIPKGAKFIEGIKEEDFDRFYTSYLKHRFYINGFAEWLYGQELYPGDCFEVNVKDLLYDLPIATKTMMLLQLGFKVGTYEFQPMNHRDGYYEHFCWFCRGSL